MGFHGLYGFAALQDAAVVALVFGGQLGGEEVGVGAAENFFQRQADRLAEALVGEGEAALEVFAKNILRQVFDQRVIEVLGIAEAFGDILAGGDVFDDTLVIEQIAAGPAGGADILRDPDDLAVLAVNLRLKIGDRVVLLHEADEFGTAALLHIELAGDVGDAGGQLLGEA